MRNANKYRISARALLSFALPAYGLRWRTGNGATPLFLLSFRSNLNFCCSHAGRCKAKQGSASFCRVLQGSARLNFYKGALTMNQLNDPDPPNPKLASRVPASLRLCVNPAFALLSRLVA